jgi:hypothetical protein
MNKKMRKFIVTPSLDISRKIEQVSFSFSTKPTNFNLLFVLGRRSLYVTERWISPEKAFYFREEESERDDVTIQVNRPYLSMHYCIREQGPIAISLQRMTSSKR